MGVNRRSTRTFLLGGHGRFGSAVGGRGRLRLDQRQILLCGTTYESRERHPSKDAALGALGIIHPAWGQPTSRWRRALALALASKEPGCTGDRPRSVTSLRSITSPFITGREVSNSANHWISLVYGGRYAKEKDANPSMAKRVTLSLSLPKRSSGEACGCFTVYHHQGVQVMWPLLLSARERERGQKGRVLLVCIMKRKRNSRATGVTWSSTKSFQTLFRIQRVQRWVTAAAAAAQVPTPRNRVHGVLSLSTQYIHTNPLGRIVVELCRQSAG